MNSTETVEGILRQELAHGETMRSTVTPILRHLLASDGGSVFSDEIIARVRGMLESLAVQLVDALARADGEDGHSEAEPAQIAALTSTMMANATFLGHLHALALEWQLAEQLRARLGLDPVLPPLLQTLIASPQAEIAASAMQLLAANARFAQGVRRMSLPLTELPGDLFHAALLAMRAQSGAEPHADARAAMAQNDLRALYDEARNRLGLITRLVAGMGGEAVQALSVTNAGTGMFLTALSLASAQDRDLAVFSVSESQLARLALSLRAAGLKQEQVEEQFLAIHPDIPVPVGFEQIGPDRAAALLSMAAGTSGP